MDSENTLLQSLISVSLCIKIASRRSDQRSVLCLFFHTLTLPSSCCGQNLDSSFNIMFLHPDSQYLGAPRAQKNKSKRSCLALAEKITQKFPWVQPTHSALLLIHKCVFLQMWHHCKGKQPNLHDIRHIAILAIRK